MQVIQQELKSIISVEEKLWYTPKKNIAKEVSLADNHDGIIRHENTKKRVPSLPKRYLPYQLEKKSRVHHKRGKEDKQISQERKELPQDEVVCQSVGSNGTVFYLERDNVETVERDETRKDKTLGRVVIKRDASSKRVVNLNKQEEKEPVRKVKVTAKAGGCSPQAAENTLAFVAILLHALKCSSCEKPACKKMRMVLQHYKQCAFKRKVSLSEGSGGPASGHGLQNCKICSQLLKIVGQHARSECRLQPGQKGCPVLMCDNFRAALHKKQVQIKEPIRVSPAGSAPIILGI